MLTITLHPGEAIRVEIAETTCAFEVDYASSEPNRLTVTSELSGNVCGGEGVIYEEEWDDAPTNKE